MNVSVFGGSSPKPGDIPYVQAYRLGKVLAERGHIVLTGGYIGTMEAVSKGAAEANGHVIGVTCDEIEDWRPVSPNPYLKEEWRFSTVRQRLAKLIDACDIALALPGGIGTLAEVSVMWSNIQTNSISPRPLILLGSGWNKLIGTFYAEFDSYVPETYRSLVTLAGTVEEALQKIP